MRVIANPYVEEQERQPEAIKRFPEQLIRSAMAGVMNYVDDPATDPVKTCMPAGPGIGVEVRRAGVDRFTTWREEILA